MAGSPLLGIVTIGQTPRPDLVRAFEAHAPGARVEVLGALDGLTIVEIDALAARPTDYPLLVKLADGSSRSIGMAVLHPLVEARAQEFGSLGAGGGRGGQRHPPDWGRDPDSRPGRRGRGQVAGGRL